jgi:type II secretory pathway pseudopilin PulG
MIYHRSLSTNSSGGFTFIEFVVIISIFAIMSGFVLANYRSFNRSVETQNLAHDIALLIKRTQSSGISAASSVGSPTTRFGLALQSDSGVVTTITSYRKSGDVGLGAGSVSVGYDAASATLLDTISISQPDALVSVCDIDTAGACVGTLSDPVYIEFERPSPEPLVSGTSLPIKIRVSNTANTSVWYISVGPAGNIYVTRS